MTEPGSRVKSEDGDEDSRVFEDSVSEAPQVEAGAAVMASGVPRKEVVVSDFSAGPSATVIVNVTEQASVAITEEREGVKVGVTDEEEKGSIPEKEEERKGVTIEQEKGSTPSLNVRRRAERKKKMAGNDCNAEPSRTAPVKVEDQVTEVMITNSEGKNGEGGNKEAAAKGEAVDERTKEGALSNTGSRTQKRKKVALAVATTSAAAAAEATKDNEEQAAVADEVKGALSKGEGEKEEVPDERNKISTLSKRPKRLQKMKTTVSANAETTKENREKTDVADKVESALSKDKGRKEVVLDEGEKASTLNKKAKSLQEIKTLALTIATTAAAETTNDNSEKEVADEDKVNRSLRKRNKNKKKKKKKRNKAQLAASEAAGAAEVGAVKKLSVAKEHAGMIFMCNAETKKDCYWYKVLGMPAGKKETVAKVYKGMKLFLYDIDLKLLYGIYVATSKGGYNIQPKAFKSGFPSQVRFKVFKDCLPLPEEKFKAAIKENYYKKKKFSLELSAEQVNKLLKLFVKASRERVPQNFTSHDSKRRQFQGAVRRPSIDEDDRIFPRSLGIYEREGYASQVPLQVPFPPPGPAVPLQAPLLLYASPPRLAPPLSLPPPAYAYERPRDVDYYRRELPVEARGYRVTDLEMGQPFDHVGHNDPYSLSREPVSYLETRYPVSLPSGYHARAPPPY